ncbi:MAG: radical SAM protein [Patescibacteria group bacterium]
MGKTIKSTGEYARLGLSRFCHVFARGDALCLYHALGISPVYLGLDFGSLLDMLRRSASSTDVLASSPLSAAETTDLLAKLRAKKFLITDEAEDDRQLAAVQERYLGHPAVAVMYLLVTDACNLSCSYCFVKNNMPAGYRTEKMTPERADAAVRFFAKQIRLSGVEQPQVIFYGGEPLLNLPAVKSAMETIETLRSVGDLPAGTQMTLITNGVRVTADIARFLKTHDVTAVVSLDGPEELTSPLRLQGRDTLYREIVRGLETLKDAGARVGISCTLGETSVARFDALLQWVKAAGVSSVGFNIVRPVPPFSLSPDYPEAVAAALIRGYESLTAIGINEDRMGRKVRAFAEGTPYPFDCAGCGNQIVVSPSGRWSTWSGRCTTGCERVGSTASQW